MAFTGASDELEMPWPEKYSQRMIAGAWNSTDGPVLTFWDTNYKAIRSANLFLKKIQNTPMDESERQQWIGEVHFLRGFFYFLLLRMYGPVPIIDHVIPLNSNFRKYKRTPLKKGVKFIVQDCDTAISKLPMTYDHRYNGRATKAAALALKERVLLYMASPLWNGNSDYNDLTNKDGTHLFPTTYKKERWQKAANAAKRCITESKAAGYHLYYSDDRDPVHSYEGLFLDNWNKEILFALNEGNTYNANDFNRGAFPHSYGGWGGYSPTQNLIDQYQMANGKSPITGYKSDGTPIINTKSGYKEKGFTNKTGKYWPSGISNMYVNREPRFYASINYNGAMWKGRRIQLWFTGADGLKSASRDHCVTGYLIKKFVDPEVNIPQGEWSTITWIYFRLGGIYLDYAEALNEAQGPVHDVYAYVDSIRTRAGLSGLPKGLSQDQMRKAIHHERRIEMAFGIRRYFDARRWKTAKKYFAGKMYGMNINAGNSLQDPAFYQRKVTSDRIFTTKDYLWPIPQSEMNRNHNMVQNPGW
jgi:hypothetical protein